MVRYLLLALVLLALLTGAALWKSGSCWRECPNGYACVIYGCDGGVPVRE